MRRLPPGQVIRRSRPPAFIAPAAPALLGGLAALACALLAAGCLPPKPLYDGPRLPADKAAVLRGQSFFRQTQDREKRVLTTITGRIVVVGLDGRILNRRSPVSGAGEHFELPPGRHTLLCFAAYEVSWYDESKGFLSNLSHARSVYSDLFDLVFTAGEGRKYRYAAEFFADTISDDYEDRTVVFARPAVEDVTGRHGGAVSEPVPSLPLEFDDLKRVRDGLE